MPTKAELKRKLVRAGVALPTADLTVDEYQRMLSNNQNHRRASDTYRNQLDMLEDEARRLGEAPVPLSVQAKILEQHHAKEPGGSHQPPPRQHALPHVSAGRAQQPQRSPLRDLNGESRQDIADSPEPIEGDVLEATHPPVGRRGTGEPNLSSTSASPLRTAMIAAIVSAVVSALLVRSVPHHPALWLADHPAIAMGSTEQIYTNGVLLHDVAA